MPNQKITAMSTGPVTDTTLLPFVDPAASAALNYKTPPSGLLAWLVSKGVLVSNNNPTGNFLIAGGGVVATGNLGIMVSAAVYSIQGIVYQTAQFTGALAAADATNPRFDAVVVDSNSVVSIVAGTPAATPALPVLDPSTQLALSFIRVDAAATSITFVNKNIYLENTEWTSSSSGSGWTLASTVNPFAGTKDIEATGVVAGAFVNLLDSANNNLQNYNNVVFYIRSKAAWAATKALQLRFLDVNGVQVGATITFKENTFGFVSSVTTSYQQIVIPVGLFQAGGLNARQLRITVAGAGAAIGFYLDNILIQGGIPLQPPMPFMRWAGAYSATEGYNANDVVQYGREVYVALAGSTGQTPATATGFWQSVFPVGVTTLTDAATVAVDASLNDNFRVTLAGNRTLGAPTNPRSGQVINFRIVQDATGTRTLAYNAVFKFPGGTAPVLSTAASAKDFMSCQYDSTEATWFCVLNKAFA